jgi:hypothetical protein
MELEIRNHPKVNDVLVVGHGKFQSALLIELKLGETAVDEGLVEDTGRLSKKQQKLPGACKDREASHHVHKTSQAVA